MKVMEKNVMRLVAVQHLRAAYGIKTKNWNKNKAANCKTTASSSVSTESRFHIELTAQFTWFPGLIWENVPVRIISLPWTWYCLVCWIKLAYFWKHFPHRWDPFVHRPSSPVSVTADALFGCSRDYSPNTFCWSAAENPDRKRATLSPKSWRNILKVETCILGRIIYQIKDTPYWI